MKTFIIAAPKSNAGKTTVTLGLLRLLKRNGVDIQPFKSGPDYIDPKFHELACGKKGANLDLFMMGKTEVENTLSLLGQNKVNCIEGVMGLFDGAKKDEGSTAELAKEINAPVVLVVDAKAVAYSVAPLIKGFKEFDPKVNIVGVIFNKVGSDRHYQILKEACEDIGAEALGYLSKIPEVEIPSRHLGLNIADIQQYSCTIDLIADEIDKNVDWERLLALIDDQLILNRDNVSYKTGVKFAIAQDAAFNFSYLQTIHAMQEMGTVTFFSPLKDKELPIADFVYFPGGYPECYLNELSENKTMLKSVRTYANNGGQIFAECGGMMYLGKSIFDKEGVSFNMVGHFNFSTSMKKAKLNLGYRIVTLNDCIFRGHEFHYSKLTEEETEKEIGTVINVRNKTVNTKMYKKKNVLASYIHLYIGNTEILKKIMRIN